VALLLLSIKPIIGKRQPVTPPRLNLAAWLQALTGAAFLRGK